MLLSPVLKTECNMPNEYNLILVTMSRNPTGPRIKIIYLNPIFVLYGVKLENKNWIQL